MPLTSRASPAEPADKESGHASRSVLSRGVRPEGIDFPNGGLTQELEFETTNDMVVDTSSARPMVSFQMEPDDNDETPRATLEVFILDQFGAERRICRYSMSGGTMRSTLEPFNPEWIRKGNNEMNKLIFKADIGAGRLLVRNVVVFFMRDI